MAEQEQVPQWVVLVQRAAVALILVGCVLVVVSVLWIVTRPVAHHAPEPARTPGAVSSSAPGAPGPLPAQAPRRSRACCLSRL